MQRTLAELNEDLLQAAQMLEQRQALLARREELQRLRSAAATGEQRASAALTQNREQVERLTRIGLAALLASLKGEREARLTQARQEERSAVQRWTEAVRALEAVDHQLLKNGQDLTHYAPYQNQVCALRAEKSMILQEIGGPDGLRLAQVEEELTRVAQWQERREAAYEMGRAALSALNEVEYQLDDAESLADWNTFGGGGLLTMRAKYDRIDDAKAKSDEASCLLAELRTLLEGEAIPDAPEVEVSGGSIVADVAFDSLLAGISVRSQIQDCQSGAAFSRERVQALVMRLKQECGDYQQRLAALRQERDTLLDRN